MAALEEPSLSLSESNFSGVGGGVGGAAMERAMASRGFKFNSILLGVYKGKRAFVK